jgi:malonyl-CoA O-methyltransferase
MSRRAAVRETFDRNAGTYDQHAALEAEVCRRLLERVAYRRGDPGVIIDLGCGTGVGLASLKRSFRKAQVMGHARLTRPIRLVEADLAALPIAAHSADLVFSNLALPWVERWDRVFEDVSRVLKPGGMFLFSMYGAGSLPQLVSALAESGVRPPAFPDILVVGDALTAAGFREPVMDVDLITMDYPGLDDMAREIEATGTALLLEDWPKLRSVLGSLERNWSRDGDNQRFPLGFEIVYGAAFGAPEGQPRRTAEGEVATFSVDSLLKSRNLL